MKIILESPRTEEHVEIEEEFEWVQFTYHNIRVSPDGNDFGFMDENGYWNLTDKVAERHKIKKGPWSDVIIG